MNRRKMNRREKVLATLELLLDYLVKAENNWEGDAYQAIAHAYFYLSDKKTIKILEQTAKK